MAKVIPLSENQYILWPTYAEWVNRHFDLHYVLIVFVFALLALYLASPAHICRKILVFALLIPLLHVSTSTSNIVRTHHLSVIVKKEYDRELLEGWKDANAPLSEAQKELVHQVRDDISYIFAWLHILLFLIPTVLALYAIRFAFSLARRSFSRTLG